MLIKNGKIYDIKTFGGTRNFWLWWQDSWFYPEHLEKLTIKRALESVSKDVSGVLLDVGCGKKPYAGLFSGTVTKHWGVEYPPSVGEGIDEVKADFFADAIQLPVPNDSVDTVLCTQVLEHLPLPEKFMNEVWRVLKPGGILILTTNQEWGIHKAPHDYYRFTRYGLKFLCDQAGLECNLLNARGGFWMMMGQRIAAYLFDRWVARYRKDKKILFLILFLFLSPCIAFIQLSSWLMDRVDHLENNTLGYFLKARKPEGKDNT